MDSTDKRIWQADALRGLALINMLAYHTMYDIVYIFGVQSSWYDIVSPACHVWQQFICQSFLLVSGYSFSLARRPLKNGLITAGCAAVLTVVTVFFMPSEAIWWGVLHLNAAAVLLACALRPVLEKIPAGAGLGVCTALFLLTNQLPQGYLGFESLHLCAVPRALYAANLFWLGLPDLTRFASADYFPLLPWLFLYGCGLFAARLLRPKPAAPPAACAALCAVGRRTLAIYMLHQPVIYGILYIYYVFLQ